MTSETKKIFIADDDPDILAILSMMLRTSKYQVDASTNANDVFKYSNNLPDLILLDIWMSGLDGREICKRLKEDKLTKKIPVIFVSANSNIEEIVVENNNAIGIKINNEILRANVVLSGADYHHTETLLPKEYRQYSEAYWDKKTFAPSSLLFYVGFDKKLKNVCHHNLFFDTDFDKHAIDIYDHPKWPTEPLFYANFTSLTNQQTAPEGCENGFFLIPIAPNLTDNEQLREQYFEKIITRFEKITKQDVRKNIIFKKSFCVNDFKSEYNSYKGNAYGLANTLLQTAVLRPNLKSKKIGNLYFTGQLTVPGPGVPPALISGKLVSQLIQKYQ